MKRRRDPNEWIKRCELCGKILPKDGKHNCTAKIFKFKDEILSLYAKGFSQGAIADYLNISQASVCKLLKREGRKARSRHHWSRTIIIPDDHTILAYTAGLLDGEGWITIGQRRWGKKLIDFIGVGISNNYLPLIDWLHNTYNCGYVYSARSKLTRRFNYTWRITRMIDAYLFLKAVRPWLVIKRDKALHAIEVAERVTDNCIP